MARNNNGNRSSGRGTGNRSGSRSSYSSSGRGQSRQSKSQNSLLSLAVITLVIFAATVALFAVAFSMLNLGGGKSDDTSSAPNVSNTNTTSTTIVTFEDNEDVSSEEASSEEDVSSAPAHPTFEGTWKKTEVYETAKATITVSNQTDDGFDFTFKIWADSKTSSISGTASFTKTKIAVYSKGNASLTFEYGSKYLSVYHSGSNSALGFTDAVTIDGKFTQGTPNYYTKEETNSYDYDVYKSSAVVKALKSTLSADDYELYQEMMSKGLKSPIPYERTLDKNGKKVNVDSELDCVKYYANLSSIGMDMILICSNSGKIYVLFYDADEMRYYTNDKNYASKMPKSFQTTAESTGLTPIYK